MFLCLCWPPPPPIPPAVQGGAGPSKYSRVCSALTRTYVRTCTGVDPLYDDDGWAHYAPRAHYWRPHLLSVWCRGLAVVMALFSFICIYIYFHTDIHIRVCMYIYYISICVYTYIHIHKQTHTYTHIYIHPLNDTSTSRICVTWPSTQYTPVPVPRPTFSVNYIYLRANEFFF